MSDVEREPPTEPDALGPQMPEPTPPPGGVEGVGPIIEDVGEDSGALDEHGRDQTRPDASP